MEELKNLDETLKEKASLKNMEDFIMLEGEVDLKGKVMWTGGNLLSFRSHSQICL